MVREFVDGDRHKTVVTPAGLAVGRVTDIHGDRATVSLTDDQDSLTGEVKSLLGWDDDDDEDRDGGDGEREIAREHVERYEDDAVHLRKGP